MKVHNLDNGDILDIRQEVLNFAVEMEKKLKLNDYKEHWRNCNNTYLFLKLLEEINELKTALALKEETNDLPSSLGISECADVANFCMMIADNLKGE